MPVPTFDTRIDADGDLWQDDARTVAVTANGQNVAAMDDMDGQGRHAITNNTDNEPLYHTNVQNGLPGVLFDGVNDALNLVGFTLADFISQPNFYLFAVVKGVVCDTNFGTIYQNDAIVSDSSGFWGLYLRNNAGSMTAALYVYDGGEKEVSVPINDTDCFIIEAWQTGGNIYIRANGGAPSSAAAAAVTTVGGGVNFGSGYLGAKFQGYLLEAGIVQGYPGDTDRDDNYNRLNTKWLGAGPSSPDSLADEGLMINVVRRW